MRVALLMAVAFCAAGLGAFGSSAFNAAEALPRGVSVQVVQDSGAYLAVAANPSSPHRCFVAESDGVLTVSFGSASGCHASGSGSGINAGSAADPSKSVRYAFHEILRAKNAGTKDVRVWVNASTTSGSGSLLETAAEGSAGQMSDADYGTAAASVLLPPGSSALVGIRLTTGTLASGSVTGTLRFEARLG